MTRIGVIPVRREVGQTQVMRSASLACLKGRWRRTWEKERRGCHQALQREAPSPLWKEPKSRVPGNGVGPQRMRRFVLSLQLLGLVTFFCMQQSWALQYGSVHWVNTESCTKSCPKESFRSGEICSLDAQVWNRNTRQQRIMHSTKCSSQKNGPSEQCARAGTGRGIARKKGRHSRGGGHSSRGA